jgi:prevent-host-death family protein
MKTVSIRELRNAGGEVIERVEHGEVVTITRDGRPVAELRPVGRAPLSTEVLLQRWRGVPRIDFQALRADIDATMDTSL